MAGGRTRFLRIAQGCAIMLAPSFARCETNRASVNAQGCAMAVTQSRYARMHKDSHTKPLHDATAQMAVDAQMHRPPMTAIRHPATLPPTQLVGYYFGCGGRENPLFAGRARMRDNACPKFRTMRNQQSKRKRAMMRDSGHTKSVHDAPTANDRNSTVCCFFKDFLLFLFLNR